MLLGEKAKSLGVTEYVLGDFQEGILNLAGWYRVGYILGD